jgi:hypothetical protein
MRHQLSAGFYKTTKMSYNAGIGETYLGKYSFFFNQTLSLYGSANHYRAGKSKANLIRF